MPRRLISLLLIFCLTFAQTAQAYSLAGLPHTNKHTPLSLINNKGPSTGLRTGNIGKTLDDLGKSENVKALVTAMVTKSKGSASNYFPK